MTFKTLAIYMPAVSSLGGAEKYAFITINYLLKNYIDLQITILVDTISQNIRSLSDLPTFEVINETFGVDLAVYRSRVSYRLIRTHKYKKEGGFVSSLKNYFGFLTINRISKQYDYFINNLTPSLHFVKPRKLAIHFVHCPPKPYRKYAVGILRLPFFYLIFKYYDTKYYSSYQYFILNSHFSAGWFRKWWGDKDSNLRIINPPIDIPTFKTDLVAKENIILNVGRFVSAKKQLELVKFYKNNADSLKNYKLVFYGTCGHTEEGRKYFKELQEISRGCNVEININSSYFEVIEAYKRAKIYWHANGYGEDENTDPIKTEHFGMTTVEAMAYGCAVVTHNSGGQKEIITDGFDGFLWETEANLISKTLALLVDGVRIKISQAGIATSLKYSTTNFETNLKEFFETIF